MTEHGGSNDGGDLAEYPVGMWVGLDSWGDPFARVEFPVMRDDERMRPDQMDMLALKLLSAAASMRVHAAIYRDMILSGKSPEEARAYVLSLIQRPK